MQEATRQRELIETILQEALTQIPEDEHKPFLALVLQKVRRYGYLEAFRVTKEALRQRQSDTVRRLPE